MKKYNQVVNEISTKLIASFLQKAGGAIRTMASSSEKQKLIPLIKKRAAGIAAAKKRPMQFYTSEKEIKELLSIAPYLEDRSIYFYKIYKDKILAAIKKDRNFMLFHSGDGISIIDANKTADMKKIASFLQSINMNSSSEFSEFMVKSYTRGEYRQEDMAHVGEQLKKFEEIKDHLPIKDINQYKRLRDVYKAINKADVTALQTIMKTVAITDGAKIIVDRTKFKLVQLETKAAVNKLCADTHWCFTGSYYDNYKHDLYLIIANINNQIRRFAFHVESGQFMDEQDSPVDIEDILSLVKLDRTGFWKAMQIYLVNNTKKLLQWSVRHGIRATKEIENSIGDITKAPVTDPYLAYSTSTSHILFSYYEKFFKPGEKWKLLEHYIKDYASLAYIYASKALKPGERFIDGEKAILGGPRAYAIPYVFNILKKQTELADEAVLCGGKVTDQYKYALEIVKGRFVGADNAKYSNVALNTLHPIDRAEYARLRNEYFQKYVPKPEWKKLDFNLNPRHKLREEIEEQDEILSLKSFHSLISEVTFNDIYHVKDKWFRVNGDRIKDLGGNFHALVDGAYREVYGTGHVSFASPKEVTNSGFWTAIDLDDDPDADAVIFGRMTPQGFKIRGIGHDSQKKSKASLLAQLLYLLNRGGYWIEASDKLESILRAKGAPIVNDINNLQKLFPASPQITLNTDGSYMRGEYKETTFGKPKGF
jgi:hypothetical protein